MYSNCYITLVRFYDVLWLKVLIIYFTQMYLWIVYTGAQRSFPQFISRFLGSKSWKSTSTQQPTTPDRFFLGSFSQRMPSSFIILISTIATKNKPSLFLAFLGGVNTYILYICK